MNGMILVRVRGMLSEQERMKIAKDFEKDLQKGITVIPDIVDILVIDTSGKAVKL